MERLSEGLRATLSPLERMELQLVLSKEAEEAQVTERALRMAIQKTAEDLGEVENSMKAENEAWQMEKERLEAAVKKTRRYEQEEVRLDLSLLGHDIKMMSDKTEEERRKTAALEKSQQRVLSLLEMEKDIDELMVKDPECLQAESDNWIRWTQDRVDSALSTALTTAAAKQKWLRELKIKAQECTVVNIPLFINRLLKFILRALKHLSTYHIPFMFSTQSDWSSKITVSWPTKKCKTLSVGK